MEGREKKDDAEERKFVLNEKGRRRKEDELRKWNERGRKGDEEMEKWKERKRNYVEIIEGKEKKR